MDSLLKASENFEQVSDEFDEKLFVEFMNKITIWNFFGISKEQYLAIPEQEKRVKISQYYSDMKSKSTGEFVFFLFNSVSEMSEIAPISDVCFLLFALLLSIKC